MKSISRYRSDTTIPNRFPGRTEYVVSSVVRQKKILLHTRPIEYLCGPVSKLRQVQPSFAGRKCPERTFVVYCNMYKRTGLGNIVRTGLGNKRVATLKKLNMKTKVKMLRMVNASPPRQHWQKIKLMSKK